nr:crosslink repair DNA glycosylase YcaQ family protein [Conexibacter sp. DBS9H8]
MGSETLSAAAARRIALAAQGFQSGPRDDDRPPGLAQLTRLVRRLGLLQLDSVNVFCRAHYMPIFSRLGPYDRGLLDRISAHGRGPYTRRLVEYWAHEASLVPVELHPLLRWRMDDLGGAWGSLQRLARDRPELIAATRRLVHERGPVRARETGAVRVPAAAGAMWNWHEGKVALEYLFYRGEVGAARRINFERHYDLIGRILAPDILAAPTPPRADAERELVRIAARALGVAAEPDLGDYFRLERARSRTRVAELVETGELIPVEVTGWTVPAYLWHEAARPRRIEARALISPFDSLIFFRPRTERLFGFRYRIEIYTPAPARVYGYYVLPFLLGDRLVARVDLKADRRAGVLRVHGAYAEAGVDIPTVSVALARELALAAVWLGLGGGVICGDRGDLIRALKLAL